MNHVRARVFLLTLFGCLLLSPVLWAQLKTVGDGGAGPVKAQHLTAELTTAAGAIAPGGTVEAGLVLTLEQKWHVYWVNAGDAGEAPHISWTLPKGVTVGAMQFPIPTRLPLGTLMDFGYEDAVAFPFVISAAKGVAAGPLHLDALVTWVVCSSVCVPGKAHLGVDLKVETGAPAAATATAGVLAEAKGLLPKALPAGASVTVSGGKDEYVVTLLSADKADDAEIYPFDQDLIANAADQDVQQVPGGMRVWVPQAAEHGALPKQFHGLIRLSDEKAYEFTSPVTPGEVPEPASARGGAAPSGARDVTAWGAIGLAFLGGILLNLMPCVFPVLFLKGLALVQSSGERRSTLRAHGFVYALGILVSFWTIVAVLLALRSGTNQIGWGFQLQSPAFVAALAIGIFFFALSLAGQFELGLSVTSAGDSLTRKQGYTGSFFTGVLAVVVATPCTAPLMGAAIGFALAQSAAITFAVFTALALGLALPYVLLTLQPSWTRWLPRPGAWMETLKHLTAVPLFATVVWLVWVFGRLFSAGADGVDRVALMMLGLLLVAMGGYAMRRWQGKWTGVAVAAVLVAAAFWVPLHGQRAAAEERATWAPWSADAVTAAEAQGHAVFVDYTAAWCLSCQVNERAVLNSAEVQERFREKKITLLRADWTKYDPAITAALGAVGRSGVPTYVLYPAAKGGAPDVLPELLSKGVVLGALAK